MSNVLKKTEIREMSLANCRRSLKNAYPSQLPDGVTEDLICVNPSLTNSNTCEGDSGSAITMKNNEIHYIYGITSSGSNCHSNSTSLYAKVTPQYIKWIEKVVWNVE